MFTEGRVRDLKENLNKIREQKLSTLCSLAPAREEETKNQTEIHLRMKMNLPKEKAV